MILHSISKKQKQSKRIESVFNVLHAYTVNRHPLHRRKLIYRF